MEGTTTKIRRATPKDKTMCTVLEGGVLILKKRKKVTAEEKRAKKNKSLFWNRNNVPVKGK